MKTNARLSVYGHNVLDYAKVEGLTFGQAYDQLVEEYVCPNCGDELTEEKICQECKRESKEVR